MIKLSKISFLVAITSMSAMLFPQSATSQKALPSKTAAAATAAAKTVPPATEPPAPGNAASPQPLPETAKPATEAATTDRGPAAKATDAVDASSAVPSADKDYIIGEQDVIGVTVWKEPELSGKFVVRPDGKISLPLINEVSVLGMTTPQLQTLLTEKYKPFVTVPEVSISVQEIHSRKVYVIGQVGHEGSFPINSSSSVLQIIAEAGGLREFAARKKIYVLRSENGKRVRLPFNYDEVIQGKNDQQDIQLRPGDTVVVP